MVTGIEVFLQKRICVVSADSLLRFLVLISSIADNTTLSQTVITHCQNNSPLSTKLFVV